MKLLRRLFHKNSKNPLLHRREIATNRRMNIRHLRTNRTNRTPRINQQRRVRRRQSHPPIRKLIVNNRTLRRNRITARRHRRRKLHQRIPVPHTLGLPHTSQRTLRGPKRLISSRSKQHVHKRTHYRRKRNTDRKHKSVAHYRKKVQRNKLNRHHNRLFRLLKKINSLHNLRMRTQGTKPISRLHRRSKFPRPTPAARHSNSTPLSTTTHTGTIRRPNRLHRLTKSARGKRPSSSRR